LKRTVCFVFVLLFCFILCSCDGKETAPEREEIVINIPTDNTVNGYRTEAPATEDLPDVITVDKVQVGTANPPSNSTSQNGNSQNSYCGNVNSKPFHKADCSSATSMKAENKFYSKDRNYFITNNYKPCKKCNP